MEIIKHGYHALCSFSFDKKFNNLSKLATPKIRKNTVSSSFFLCFRIVVLRVMLSGCFLGGIFWGFSLVGSLEALAEDAVSMKLTTLDKKDLNRGAKYLESVKTLRGQFLQVSSNGRLASGKIYMSRPGRMRFEYDPPDSILMIADGLFFVYIDRDLEQTTHVFLKSTPLSFLVQEKIVFEGDVTVTKIVRSPGILKITIKKTKEPEMGSIKLVFSDKPLALKKWVVVDAQNIETTVNLTGTQTGIKLDPKLFTYSNKKRD